MHLLTVSNVSSTAGRSRPQRQLTFWVCFSFWLLTTLLIAPLAGCQTSQPHRSVPTASPIALPNTLAQRTLLVPTLAGTSTLNPGALVALNAQTGKVRWQFAPAGMAGTPAVGQGIVYVAPEDDHIYAIDTATGKPIWAYQRSDGSVQTGVDGYPFLLGNTLYVSCDAGSVYALDARTGALRWHTLLPANPSNSTHPAVSYATPTGAAGLIFVSSWALFALDANTGGIRWHVAPLDGSTGFENSTPTVAGGFVYVGDDRELFAMEAQSGNIRWHIPTVPGYSLYTPPQVGNGLVYIGLTDEGVYAYDALTGTMKWHFQGTGSFQMPINQIPTGAALRLVGANLYVGGQGGNMYALMALDGTVQWTRSLDSAIESPPSITEGILYVGTLFGQVYALWTSDGAVAWSYNTYQGIYGSPAIQ